MRELKETLLSNLPENMRTNDLIIEYVDAISEEFERARLDIYKLRNQTDYSLVDPSTATEAAGDFGITFPRNVAYERKQLIIRDAEPIIGRLGTRQALEWVVRFLGISDYQIREVWAPNPELLRKGYYRALKSTNPPVRYNVRKNSFREFYLGETYTTANGTFFRGYEYEDPDEENLIDGIPIVGESYTNINDVDFTDTVSKTPYLILRADGADYGQIVDPFISRDESLILDSDLTDQERIVSELLNYFIQTLQRTATTKIVFLGDRLFFTDEFEEVLDTFEQDQFEPPAEFDDEVEELQSDYINFAINNDYNPNPIGNIVPVGSHPIFAPTFYANHQITVNGFQWVPDYDSRFIEYNYDTYPDLQNDQHTIFTDIFSKVTFTAPEGSELRIFKSLAGSDPSAEYFAGTLGAGQKYEVFEQFNHITRFELVDASVNDIINVDVTYILKPALEPVEDNIEIELLDEDLFIDPAESIEFESEVAQFDAEANNSSTVPTFTETMIIGEQYVIGEWPSYRAGEYVTNVIGSGNDFLISNEEEITIRGDDREFTIRANPDYSNHPIFTDFNALVQFQAPSDTDVLVEYRTQAFDNTTQTTFGVVPAGSLFAQSLEAVNMVILNFVNGSTTENLNINIQY